MLDLIGGQFLSYPFKRVAGSVVGVLFWVNGPIMNIGSSTCRCVYP